MFLMKMHIEVRGSHTSLCTKLNDKWEQKMKNAASSFKSKQDSIATIVGIRHIYQMCAPQAPLCAMNR